jgi:hypothetical protein
MSGIQIFCWVFFGLVGMGYAYSGKRHGNGRLFFCGLALGIFPYFVDHTLLLILIGSALIAYPLLFHRH